MAARGGKNIGIEVRHSPACPAREAGARCACSPKYRAEAFSARDGKKLRKTFASLPEAKAWRADAQVGLRRGTISAAASPQLAVAAHAWLAGASTSAETSSRASASFRALASSASNSDDGALPRRTVERDAGDAVLDVGQNQLAVVRGLRVIAGLGYRGAHPNHRSEQDELDVNVDIVVRRPWRPAQLPRTSVPTCWSATGAEVVDVELMDGTIRGAEDAGIVRFLGVPYAAAPFGAERMRPPAPVVGWTGTRDATAYGATCPKGEFLPELRELFPDPTIAGDDCLNLNVWTPAAAIGSGALPVLVWIHGGAFVQGSGAVGAYDGSAFARSGVVCVTTNYRLGPEGFLFTEGDESTDSANAGLQDQVAALRWVRDNVSRFGGDPSRVTVAGESAGAMSIATLLATPTADGLFAQVIIQSGSCAHTMGPETALQVARTFAGRLGTEPTRVALAALDRDVLAKAASDFSWDAQENPDPGMWGALALRMLPFAPVVDGTVLPRHPLEALAEGASNTVRMLIGSNREEARLFVVPSQKIDLVDEPTLVGTAAAYGLSPEGLEVYKRNAPGASPGDVLARIVSDWFFAIPALRMAEAHEAAGGTSWTYRFDRPLAEENDRLGSAHAVEIPFVFDTIDRQDVTRLVGQRPSRAVAESMHGTWVRFVTDGDPGWAPFTAAERTTGILTETVTAVDDPDGEERALWEGVL